MALQQIFIANIKQFRKKLGISQMILAERCGTSANYIGQIEMGRRIPSFEKIEKIAGALGIEPYRLFIQKTGEASGEKEPKTKDFLKKFPANVKNELISALLEAIQRDVTASFDEKSY